MNLGCQNNIHGKLPNDYIGKIATTTAGYKCINWISNDPLITNDFPTDGEHNYCRSLRSGDRGAWCYTNEPTISWQYCSCTVSTTGRITFNFELY